MSELERESAGTVPAKESGQTSRPLRILQVSPWEQQGGAERIAAGLYHYLRQQGQDCWLAVGERHSDDPRVLLIPNEQQHGRWHRFWRRLHARRSKARRWTWGGRLLWNLAEPGAWMDRRRGIEPLRFPGTGRLLDLPGQQPDLIHCHNLHGGYFDLRALPWLSAQVPVVLTLHDAWLLSGHCAHSFDCERWKSGCGKCPDLSIYPAVRRDATAGNWQRKQAIYARSRLYLASPCRWMLDKVCQSMLAPAVVETRLIPTGVDLSLFRPAPDGQDAARRELGLPADAAILLFAANRFRANAFRDYPMMREAAVLAAQSLGPSGKQLLLLAVGDEGLPEQVGSAQVRFAGHITDPRLMARYYQAADLYLHAARADTFPNVVLEALACGTPIVATAVGGIPEQVRSLPRAESASTAALDARDAESATGVLVKAGDARQMAEAVVRLLRDEPLIRQLGRNAAEDARRRFDMDRQHGQYLDWYRQILQTRAAGPGQAQAIACAGGAA